MKIRILFLAMFAVAVTSCREKKTAEHEHDYSCSTVKEATCTVDGESECTCTICGDKTLKVIPAKGHDYEDGKCTVCGVVKYGYKVVAVGALNIREEPSSSSQRIGGVKLGDVLLIVDIEENGEDVNGNTEWIKIAFMDEGQKVYGWVPCAYLKDPVG